tara:strand:- start:9527 stop:10462 length:936 start_codon:yes stop_codon:yes gene_type:complete
MKRKILLIIFGFLTTIFAIKVTRTTDINITNFFDYSSDFSFRTLILSLISYNISIFLRAYRLNSFLKNQSNFIRIFNLQYIATGFQLLAPFRLGDGIRIVLFKKKLGNFANSTFVFLIEKIYDFIILILMLFISSLRFNFLNIENLINQFFIIISFLIFIAFFVLYKLRKFIRNWLLKIISPSKFTVLVNEYNNSLLIFSRYKIILSFLISFFIWFFDCLSFYFVISYFNQNLLDSFILGPLTALSSILPSPPMGIYGSINIGFYWMGELTKIQNYTNIAPIYSILIYGSTICIAVFLLLTEKINSYLRKS